VCDARCRPHRCRPLEPASILQIHSILRRAARRAEVGVEATIKGLRHYNATQMLTGGIDLRTAAARLGHSGGGHITLKVYAHRTRPSDQRAAPAMPRWQMQLPKLSDRASELTLSASLFRHP